MRKRLLYVGVGLVVLMGLLGIVPVDGELLRAKEVPTSWWWSSWALAPIAGSTLPPFIGIAAVLVTRKLLPSLALGTFAAAVLSAGPNPIAAIDTFTTKYVWGSVADAFHLAILLFTAALIGLVSVANRCGGTQGIVDVIMRYAKGIRGARVSTALMGLAVFFDDYANTAIVGPTMRPLFDRMKLSREKLAYIIDSTAAPIAGLAIISTWVGAEVGYMQDAAQAVGINTSGYALFISALSYRFYCVFALVLVFVLAISGRDFGPMLAAERRALSTGQVFRPGASVAPASKDRVKPGAPARWYNAVVPIGGVLLLIVTVIYAAGAVPALGFAGLFSLANWQAAFMVSADLADGNFLAYLFAAAALFGSWLAIVMPWAQGILTLREAFAAWLEGGRSVVIPLVVLLFAWALSTGCKDLHTAAYVGAALQGLPAAWVPITVFLVSGVVAFATGTSWGTMAILIPTATAVAFEAGGQATMLIAMAAVLDGSIFGDHCSPISDTTVLSSICSGCDHLDHVRTQIPYALTGCGAASIAGYGLVGAGGMPAWLGYVFGIGFLLGVVWLLGRRADEPDATVMVS